MLETTALVMKLVSFLLSGSTTKTGSLDSHQQTFTNKSMRWARKQKCQILPQQA
jgi:hypothetical protein